MNTRDQWAVLYTFPHFADKVTGMAGVSSLTKVMLVVMELLGYSVSSVNAAVPTVLPPRGWAVS